MADRSEGPQGKAEARVATGPRRDGHYEPDAEAIVTARFTTKPKDPSVVEDVALSTDLDSVWDARPIEPDR